MTIEPIRNREERDVMNFCGWYHLVIKKLAPSIGGKTISTLRR